MTNFHEEMIKWENAFAQYVKGLETENVAMIDAALSVMKSIDAELTAKIWSEDMLTVREWRQRDRMVSELNNQGSTRFKKSEDAHSFLDYVIDKGIKAKVKSQWGKYFTVELVA